MPQISWFYGIAVYMYYADHNPPHVHVFYSGSEALMTFDGAVLRGDLPRRALRLVRTWIDRHRRDLGELWERARRGEPLGTIDPLE